MKKLSTEVMIDAPPAAVWEVLADFGPYPDWNPFVVSIEGDLEVGSRLRAQLQPPGGKATTFKPTITAVETNRYLEWLGHLGVKGLFDGRHQFKLEATGGGTRFLQSEEFTGILVPLFSRMLDGKTRAGFEAMNHALKERSEAGEAERG